MRVSHDAIYQSLYVQGGGRAQTGTGLVPAHRTRTARAAGTITTKDLGPRHPGGADQCAARRSRRPCGSRTLRS